MKKAKQTKSGMWLALACLVLVSAPLQAREPMAPRQDVMLLAQIDGAAAARAVQSQTGGKVLSVQYEERKGRAVYRVKVLLPEGRIRTVIVDADTGQVGG